MSSLFISHAQVIDPSQKINSEGGLLVEDGKIKAILKKGESPSANETIDAKGSYLLPGFLDVHVHFREPGQEHKETIQTGAQASVAGGFTAVACMANTNPINDNPFVTRYIKSEGDRSLCKVFPIGAVSKGLKGLELAEIGGMVKEGAVAISDDGMAVMDSYLMRKAMEYAKSFDVPVISHAEDFSLIRDGVMNEGIVSEELGLKGIPAASEEIMVAREIALCRLTGCRVHIAHLSTALGLELVKRAKHEGLPITAEVCPHHLFLTDENVRGYQTCCKMRPPLRTQADIQALRIGLAEGVIDMIATDHAPHAESEKNVEFDQSANGITGLQTAVALTYQLVESGELKLERWIEALTTAPAKLINQPLGTLKVGADADFILFNPKLSWNFNEKNNYSKSKNSPYLNETFNSCVEKTFSRGKKVFECEL